MPPSGLRGRATERMLTTTAAAAFSPSCSRGGCRRGGDTGRDGQRGEGCCCCRRCPPRGPQLSARVVRVPPTFLPCCSTPCPSLIAPCEGDFPSASRHSNCPRRAPSRSKPLLQSARVWTESGGKHVEAVWQSQARAPSPPASPDTPSLAALLTPRAPPLGSSAPSGSAWATSARSRSRAWRSPRSPSSSTWSPRRPASSPPTGRSSRRRSGRWRRRCWGSSG